MAGWTPILLLVPLLPLFAVGRLPARATSHMPFIISKARTFSTRQSHPLLFKNSIDKWSRCRRHQYSSKAASSLFSAFIPSDEKHVENVLFIECGFGSDAHGQNATKAAVRACRNAIEFNQIPSISQLVPGGRDGMKLDVLLAVPDVYQADLDVEVIRRCFPYGQVRFQIQNGGMVASNGKAIVEMGDVNEDMIVVCVAVTVGY